MGVFVLSLIPAMNLKSRPSSAMAHRTRGMGNMAPSRLPREMVKTNHAMQKRDRHSAFICCCGVIINEIHATNRAPPPPSEERSDHQCLQEHLLASKITLDKVIVKVKRVIYEAKNYDCFHMRLPPLPPQMSAWTNRAVFLKAQHSHSVCSSGKSAY